MDIEHEKTFRIGIDWLTLYNFKLENKSNYALVEEFTPEYRKKKFKIKEDLFYLESQITDYGNGNEKEYQTLRFNPNKILYFNNIQNSKTGELLEALAIIQKNLQDKGIVIDFNDSKIKEIEININFKKEFSQLKEALILLFKSSKDVKKISNQIDSESIKDMYVDSTLQSTHNTYSIIAYDKNRETKLTLDAPVTRLEIRLKESCYKYYMISKYGKDITLRTLLTEFNLIENLFRDHINMRLVAPGLKHLDVIYSNLEKRYERFKASSRLAVEKGVKQPRNVYKYLEEGWIFDYFFLIKIIKKYDSKHKAREIDRIKKNYIHHNNLEELDYMMNIISPLISFSGEE